MPIPFTQFLRPDGRQQQITITLDDETQAKADQILAAGYTFAIEVLRTDEVSATIADPVLDEDVAHATIVPNGPKVPEAIRSMIMDFTIPQGR